MDSTDPTDSWPDKVLISHWVDADDGKPFVPATNYFVDTEWFPSEYADNVEYTKSSLLREQDQRVLECLYLGLGARQMVMNRLPHKPSGIKRCKANIKKIEQAILILQERLK